jgi:tetratricopeptide (TPR) repeat protein
MTRQIFVAAPSGINAGIDFGAVYAGLIEPALGSAEFTVFHADEGLQGGGIPDEVFQNLLIADIVIADLTIEDAAVWYMLGVRHALRSHGVVMISGQPQTATLDKLYVAALRYRLKAGIPDPLWVQEDIASLARLVQQAACAPPNSPPSPVYARLPLLAEPAPDMLRVDGIHEFWSNETQWRNQVAAARRERWPGDLMLLAEEAPVTSASRDAHCEAAARLRELGRETIALEQVERALALDSTHLPSLHEKGLLLGRLGRFDEANAWLQRIARGHAGDGRTFALLARVAKYRWTCAWRVDAADPARRRELAAASVDLLHEAIKAHVTALAHDGTDVHCGVDAAILGDVCRRLTKVPQNATPLTEMMNEARWAAHLALSHRAEGGEAFWSRVARAELCVLADDTEGAACAYRGAVMTANDDWYLLHCARERLMWMADLGFWPVSVEVALGVVDRALESVEPPLRPRHVILFSGHMIDGPGRTEKRFPVEMKDQAKEEIGKALDKLGAGSEDLALCEGACGGDLLFAQAALKRHMHLELRLPFDETLFLEKSVGFAGPKWRKMYLDAKKHPRTRVFCMPDSLGPTPKSHNQYERVNLWQIYSAYALGPHAVRVIALWDGVESEKRGGTAHMVHAVSQHFNLMTIIDTQRLLRQMA